MSRRSKWVRRLTTGLMAGVLALMLMLGTALADEEEVQVPSDPDNSITEVSLSDMAGNNDAYWD